MQRVQISCQRTDAAHRPHPAPAFPGSGPRCDGSVPLRDSGSVHRDSKRLGSSKDITPYNTPHLHWV